MRLLVISLLAALPLSAQVQCLGTWLCRGTAAQVHAIASPVQGLEARIIDASHRSDCDATGGGVETAICVYRSGWVPLLAPSAGDSDDPTNIEIMAEDTLPAPPSTEAHAILALNRDTGELCWPYQIDGLTHCTNTDLARTAEPFVCDNTKYGGRYFDSDDQVQCVCANDGTDDHWLSSADYSHATGHCTSDPPALLSANLAARYNPWFQPGTQTLYDTSGNDENATLGSSGAGSDANDPTWKPYSLEFPSGVNAYVVTPQIDSAIESIDILFYTPAIRHFTNPKRFLLYGTANSVDITLGNVTGLQNEVFSIRSPTGNFSGWIETDEGIPAGWSLLQFNWDSGDSNWDIYLNGSQKTATIFNGETAASWPTDLAFQIGGEGNLGGGGAFGGSVSWIDMFSITRSEADLEQNALAIIAQRPGLKITPYTFEALP